MWAALKSHHAKVADRRFETLVDAGRAGDFSVSFGDMRFDYAKTNIDATARSLLIDLLETTGVAAKRDAMFAGAPINETEGRAVLHTALRNLDGGPVMVDGKDVMPEVLDTLARMERFAADVRDGRFTGQGGGITDVVNIGIGGSDLGPVMVTEAMKPYGYRLNVHFVSNVDGSHILDTLAKLNPETTLFLVASKTFTTQETMTNARQARRWR